MAAHIVKGPYDLKPEIEDIIKLIIKFRVPVGKLNDDITERLEYHDMRVFMMAVVLDEHVINQLLFAQPRVS